MKRFNLLSFLTVILFQSCSNHEPAKAPSSTTLLAGTWKLQRGTLIHKGDTSITDYTKGVSFIKIINGSHFAFLQHDLSKGKIDSPVFVSGGGTYLLKDDHYTENLEYCSAREWEGNTFEFTIQLKGDTLLQQGKEKVPGTGEERLNIEQYVRLAP